MPKNEVEIIPYAVGVVAASVCTNGALEQAIEYMDDHHPTGLSHSWSLSDQVFIDTDDAGDTFARESNTVPCNQNPETHTHYLLQC